jgi:hypothetical protein
MPSSARRQKGLYCCQIPFRLSGHGERFFLVRAATLALPTERPADRTSQARSRSHGVETCQLPDDSSADCATGPQTLQSLPVQGAAGLAGAQVPSSEKPAAWAAAAAVGLGRGARCREGTVLRRNDSGSSKTRLCASSGEGAAPPRAAKHRRRGVDHRGHSGAASDRADPSATWAGSRADTETRGARDRG